MNRKTVITIVLAALLSLILLAANPATQTDTGLYSDNNVDPMSPSHSVTFSTSSEKITYKVENGKKFQSYLPVLPASDAGSSWGWLIDGSENYLTADTPITSDLSVTAVRTVNNQNKDFMNGQSGVIVNLVGGNTSFRGKHAALSSAYSDHPEANRLWLKADVAETSTNMTVWSFEFTGVCRNNSDKDCYYYVRSADGKYLNVSENGTKALSVSDSKTRVLVHKENLNSDEFYLASENGSYWVNLKSDDPMKGFQAYNTRNSSTVLTFYQPAAESQVKIQFFSNGGNIPAPAFISAYSGTEITLPNYLGDRKGHEFKGWHRLSTANADDTGLMKAGDTFAAEPITLYAIYDNDPIIWFDANGGSKPVPAYYKGIDGTQTYPECEREGYRLLGWLNVLTPAAEPIEAGKQIANIDEDVTMRAQWQKVEQVTFVYKDRAPINKIMDVGIDYDLSQWIEISRAANQKWMYINRTGERVVVDDNYLFKMVDYPITLYEVREVTLSFDANGGATDPVSIKGETGTIIDLASSVIAERIGFTLKGWTKVGDETGTMLKTDAEIELGQRDVELKAVWEYKVTFDKGSGNTAKPADITALSDEIKVLPDYTGKSGGKYDFVGWITVPLNEWTVNKGYHRAGTPLINENGELLGNKFYALYKVSVNLSPNNGNAVTPPTGMSFVEGTKIAAVPGETINLTGAVASGRSNRIFWGWATTKEQQVKITSYVVPEKASEIYAMWGAEITFLDYAGNEVDRKQGFYQEGWHADEFTAPWTTNMPDGRVFVGWTDNLTKRTVSYLPDDTYDFKRDSFTLYAVYLGNVTVSFNVNGGSAADTLPQPTLYGSKQQITMPVYNGTKEGYTFGGWSRSSNLVQKNYSAVYEAGKTYAIPLDGETNVVFYAVWNKTETTGLPNAKFGIRIDRGTVAREPSTPSSDFYTTKAGKGLGADGGMDWSYGNVLIDNVVKSQYWVIDMDMSNPPTGYYLPNNVTAALKAVPSKDEINRILQNADLEPLADDEYVVWYVLKYNPDAIQDGKEYYWHVDGTILSRNKARLVYDYGELPTEYQSFWYVPEGKSEIPGTTVAVDMQGAYLKSGNPHHGYAFTGWKDINGKEYKAGDEITLPKGATVLYAQWDHETVDLTVSKEWDDTNVTNGRLLHTPVTVKLMYDDGKGGKPVSGFENGIRLSIGRPSVTVKDLNKHTNNIDEDIKYYWVEENVPNGYRALISTNGYSTTITNTRRAITITAGSGSKEYDGTALTGSDLPENKRYTITGDLISGDEITAIEFEGSQKNVESTTENNKVKEGSVKIMNNGEDVTYSYDIKLLPGTLTITPKEVTITAEDQTKVYDKNKDTDPELKVEIRGLVKGEGEELIKYNIDREKSKQDEGQNADTYKITVTCVEDQGNYKVSCDNAEFTISKRLVKVTAGNKSKTYGDDDPELTWTIESDNKNGRGLIAGDSLVFTIDRDSGEDVKQYPIWFSGEKDQDNYTVEFEKGTLTITPRTVTVTADQKEKIYGDDDSTVTFTAQVSNLAEGDDESLISYKFSRENGENVGKYTITPYGDGKQHNNNYDVVYETGTLTIKQREITIVGASGSKDYDGTPVELDDYSIEGTLAEFNGVKDNIVPRSVTLESVSKRDGRVDVNSVGYANIPSVQASNVIHNGSGADVTGNYDIKTRPGTLNINPLKVHIKSNTNTWVYDGTEKFDHGYTLAPQMVAGDELSVSITGHQKEVGYSNNTIDTASIKVTRGGADISGNYSFTTEEGVLTVTNRQAVSITALNGQKVYDGTPLTRNEYAVSGLAAGDRIGNITITGSVTDVTDPESPVLNVPSNARIFRGDVDVTDTYDDINYYNGTLVVTPRSVTIQAGGGNKVYDGTPLTVHTNTSWGLANGDTVSSLDYDGFRTQYGTARNNASNAVIVNADGKDVTGNYVINYLPGELKVKARPVTVIADSFTKEYGQLDPAFTVRIDGTVNNDPISYQITREAGEEPGEYTITPSGSRTQGNYEVTFITGMLTIVYNPTANTVEKVWSDDNNRDGVRPISLGVTLVGSDGSVRSRRLSDANNWTVTITDLPLYNNGARITYSWTEETVDGYTAEYRVNGNVTTIINTHEIARTSSSVSKIWNDKDNAAGTRPASLGVALRGNGRNVLSATLSDANNWTVTANNLPQNENGKPIEYIWYEQSVGNGYYAVSSTTSSNNTTLVNSNLYRLTIHYRYNDGSTAAADYTDVLAAGEVFTIDSPEIEGYNANPLTAVGQMPARDMEVIVVYTAGEEEVVTPVTPTAPVTEPEKEPEAVPTKELPEPRAVEADEEHPVVIPTNDLTEIDDNLTALGLGDVFMNNGGYSIE